MKQMDHARLNVTRYVSPHVPGYHPPLFGPATATTFKKLVAAFSFRCWRRVRSNLVGRGLPCARRSRPATIVAHAIPWPSHAYTIDTRLNSSARLYSSHAYTVAHARIYSSLTLTLTLTRSSWPSRAMSCAPSSPASCSSRACRARPGATCTPAT